MPTVRRPLLHGALPRITGEIVQLFERVEALKHAGADDPWLDAMAGSPRREYLDMSAQLHHRLGLLPHQCGVDDVGRGPTKAETEQEYARTKELRQLLLRAVKERRA